MAVTKSTIGDVFGRLTIVDLGTETHRLRKVKCHCECGLVKLVRIADLRTGHTKSCGCLASDNLSRYIHGMADNPTHVTWQNMRRRCYDKSVDRYARYGGRGITVCDRWRGSFLFFLEDMGVKPVGLTIDRIDNDGNYEKANCRWADLRTQSRNRSNNRWITIKGKTLTVAEWAESLDVSARLIRCRLSRMWCDECAVTIASSAGKCPHR